MRHWKLWDWIGYATLFVAALIVAADAALKGAPTVFSKMPDFMHSELWSFVPLALVLLGTAILLARNFGWLGRTGERPNINDDAWKNFNQWEHIYAKKYLNEEVVIDGKFFDRCEFTNASLMFNGTGPVKIEHPTWRGNVAFKIASQAGITAVHMTHYIAQVNQALTGEPTVIARGDRHGNITPINVEVTKNPK